MRSLGKAILVLSLAAAVTASASAQQPRIPGLGGIGAGVGALLRNKGVQEELKLSEEQLKKADEVLKKVGDDTKEMVAKLRDPNTTPEERAEISKKVSEAGLTALKEAIKPEQIARLKQIQLQTQMQFMGLAVLTEAEIQKTLKITDDQKADLKKLGDEVAKEIETIMQDARSNPQTFPEALRKMGAVNKEGLEKAAKMMNSDQKKVWDELVGKPFELKFEFPMRPPQ